MPLVKVRSINCLSENINAQVVVPIVNDKSQPLCAFYNNSVLKPFNTAIDRGDYSLMKLLDQIEIVKVTISSENEEQFLNINYPDDLEEAEGLLKIENN